MKIRDFRVFPVVTFGVFFLLLLKALPDEAYLIDDHALIDIPQIRANWSPQLIATWFGWNSHVDWYPFRDLTYWLDLHLFGAAAGGLDATVYRLQNLFWFVASGALLSNVLRKLGLSRNRAALITAIWFLLPFHLEMVLWISARKDVLSLFFSLAFLRLVIAAGENSSRRVFISALLAFILGQLSKASFTLLPVALWLGCFFWSRERERRARSLLFLSTILGLGFSLLQGRFYSEVNDMRYSYESSYRLMASLTALGRMAIGTMWAPVNGIDLENWGQWLPINRSFLWPGLGVALGVFLLTWRVWGDPVRRVAILGFWATYVPVSALLFPHRNFYSVRYFETPFIFLLLALVAGDALPRLKPRVFYGISFLVLVLMTFQLAHEIQHWETAPAPFLKAWRKDPENPALSRYLLRELERQERWGKLDEEGKTTLQTLRQRLRSLCGEAVDADSFRNGHLCLNLWIDERFRSSTVGIQGDLSSRISRALNDVNPDQGRFLKLWSEVESRIRGGTELPISSSELLELRTVTPERRVNALAAVCAGGDERLARARRDRWLSHSLLSPQELMEAYRFWKEKFPKKADQIRGCLLGPRK